MPCPPYPSAKVSHDVLVNLRRPAQKCPFGPVAQDTPTLLRLIHGDLPPTESHCPLPSPDARSDSQGAGNERKPPQTAESALKTGPPGRTRTSDIQPRRPGGIPKKPICFQAPTPHPGAAGWPGPRATASYRRPRPRTRRARTPAGTRRRTPPPAHHRTGRCP